MEQVPHDQLSQLVELMERENRWWKRVAPPLTFLAVLSLATGSFVAVVLVMGPQIARDVAANRARRGRFHGVQGVEPDVA